MAITVTLNSTHITEHVLFPSLSITQNLSHELDTARFSLLASTGVSPAFDDDIVIADGTSDVFAGKVIEVTHTYDTVDQAVIAVSCVDHTFELDRLLASRTYEDQTVEDIIADLVDAYAPTFTYANVACDFVVPKIVFNQLPLSQCIRRLASFVKYHWYIDEDKDLHFFPMFTNSAPFAITDTSGNYVFKSLTRTQDGSQLINRVRVRGGEYDGDSYTDTITVVGDDTKAFILPYNMANLEVELDAGGGFVSQDVGIDFIDTFDDFDVLYNFQSQSFRFENALSDGDKIRYTGNPKTPVMAVMEYAPSVAQYGPIEKLIRDTAITSNEVARKRAAAELIALSETAIDASFVTYTSGLRAGMIIDISSDLRAINDSLLIKSITFAPRTPEAFEYRIQCISTQRYSFMDVLRKIIAPDALPSDEREVAENLVPVGETLSLADSAGANEPTEPMEIVNTHAFSKNSGTTSGISFSFDSEDADALFIVVTDNVAGLTGFTFNSDAFTKDADAGTVQIWRLNNPTSGSYTLAIQATDTSSVRVIGYVYAVKGINTSDALEDTATGNVSDTHKELTVTQANDVMSIAFFATQIGGDNPVLSWTPDDPRNIEDRESGGIGGSDNPQTNLHRIFTRAGDKTIGTTYDAVPDTYSTTAEAMALYNGFDPAT